MFRDFEKCSHFLNFVHQFKKMEFSEKKFAAFQILFTSSKWSFFSKFDPKFHKCFGECKKLFMSRKFRRNFEKCSCFLFFVHVFQKMFVAYVLNPRNYGGYQRCSLAVGSLKKTLQQVICSIPDAVLYLFNYGASILT